MKTQNHSNKRIEAEKKRDGELMKTLGVTRWQPRLWGGSVTVFWAHFAAMAESGFFELFGSLTVAGVKRDFTAAGTDTGLEANKTE